jgi:hypothetical protein
MAKFLTSIFTILCFSSCMRYNEYGHYRVGLSRFTIIPNTDNRAYAIIDTNVIYRFVKDERINISGSGKPRYYKFYSNGRIAEFYDRIVNLKTDNILEAKKAQMGYYKLVKNDIVVQFYNSNANASELTNQTIEVRNDTLILINKYYNPDAEIKSFFIKESIPNHVLITKPDW